MAQNDLTMTMDPEDVRKLNEKLNQLGAVVKEGIVQRGLREGANIILKETKASIERHNFIRTGKLLSSAAIKTRKKDGKVYVGFKRPAGAAAHLLDKGTAVRHTRTGANRGRIVASNFHTDSVRRKKDEAMQVLYKSIEASLNRIWQD